MAPTKKYVLLDRDGVINHDSDDFIKSPDEWLPIDKSLEAIALLNHNGFEVIIITNQSGVGRGLYSDAILTEIHLKMMRLTEAAGGKISHIYYCPHLPDTGCTCRKPKPGMLNQFSKDVNQALDNTYFVGDSLRDIEAGIAAGAKPLLVKTGNGEKTIAAHPDLDVPIFENLYATAEFIISR